MNTAEQHQPDELSPEQQPTDEWEGANGEWPELDRPEAEQGLGTSEQAITTLNTLWRAKVEAAVASLKADDERKRLQIRENYSIPPKAIN